MDAKTAFNTDGVECPFCGHVSVPDEAFYYNQSGYVLDCGECEREFNVQPVCLWSWTSRAITWDDD